MLATITADHLRQYCQMRAPLHVKSFFAALERLRRSSSAREWSEGAGVGCARSATVLSDGMRACVVAVHGATTAVCIYEYSDMTSWSVDQVCAQTCIDYALYAMLVAGV
jgi:hypothetical protein